MNNNNNNNKIEKNLTNGNKNDKLSGFSKEIRDELDKFASVITIPVLWGHQDSLQHLNNVNWLRFAEAGRVDHNLMLSLFLKPSHFTDFKLGKGRSLIVKEVKIKYLSQVTFPDSLTIATKTKDLTSTTLIYHTKMFSHAKNKLVGECEVLMVGFDYNLGKKSEIDSDWVIGLKKLEEDPVKSQNLVKSLPFRVNSNL